jgi:Peptidase M15
MINWKDEACQVTPHFSVKDCLYLHEWKRLASIETDQVYTHRLVALCEKMELIRAMLGDTPINVHSMFRSEDYNVALGILPHQDVHSESLACDFDALPILGVEDVKQRLRPHLAALGIRMEKGTLGWVHIDMKEIGPSGREFTA